MYKEPGAYTNIENTGKEVKYIIEKQNLIDDTAPTTSIDKTWSVKKNNTEFAKKNEVKKVSSDLENVKTSKADLSEVNTLKTELTGKASKTELETKMDKGATINVSQIDKNSGKFDQTYMSQDFLQQMAGNTPVNAIPPDNSITYSKYAKNSIDLEKYAFFVKGEICNKGIKYPININKTNYEIEIKNSVYCIFNNRFINIPVQKVSWLSQENPSYLRHFYADKTNGKISVHSSQDNDVLNKIYLFSYINDDITGATCVTINDKVANEYKLTEKDMEDIQKNSIQLSKINIPNKSFDYTKIKMQYATVVNPKTFELNLKEKKLKIINKYAFVYFDDGILPIANTIYDIDISSKIALNEVPYVIFIDLDKPVNEKIIFGTIADYRLCTNCLALCYVYADQGLISNNYLGFVVVDKNNNRKEYSYEKTNGTTCPNVDNDAGGFNFNDNRMIIPPELYFIKDFDYSIYPPNFNLSWYLDNDNLLFDMALPTKFEQFKQCANLNFNLDCTYKTRIVARHKKADYFLNKDVLLKIKDPAKITNKNAKILVIGDSITNMNNPKFIKFWLNKVGINANMIGTVNNSGNTLGYGIVDDTIQVEKGEGRSGWRLTDFVCKTEKTDGTLFVDTVNPFRNPSNGLFDFSYYMNNNSFSNIDFVIIQLGTNDIGQYHYQSEIPVYNPTLEEYLNPESRFYIGKLYKIMIDSIKKFNPNIKIAINPPCGAGASAVIQPALKWAEIQQKEFKSTENVYSLASYMFFGNLSTNNFTKGELINPNNDTTKFNKSFDVHPIGTGQLVHALIGASWIVNMLD